MAETPTPDPSAAERFTAPEPQEEPPPTPFVGLPLLMDQLPGKLQMAERDQDALEAVMLALEVAHVPTPQASGGAITLGPTSLAGEIMEHLDRHGWVLMRSDEITLPEPDEEPTDDQRSEGLMRATQMADRDTGGGADPEAVLDAAERYSRFLQNGHRVGLPSLTLPADEAAQERLGEQLAAELAERVSQATGGNLAGLDAALVVLKAAQPQFRLELDQAKERRALAEPF